MDLLGNYVDENGDSLDRDGNPIEEREYFMENGKITANKQREGEYTRMLSKSIVHEFRRINQIFASHMVAFVAFHIWRNKYNQLDFFNFLRLPEEDLIIEYAEFKKQLKRVRKKALKLYERGKVDLDNHMKGDLDELINHGLDNVGLYHDKRPLIKNKIGNIITQDLNTLYFYQNRLDGYGLEKKIK